MSAPIISQRDLFRSINRKFNQNISINTLPENRKTLLQQHLKQSMVESLTAEDFTQIGGILQSILSNDNEARKAAEGQLNVAKS